MKSLLTLLTETKIKVKQEPELKSEFTEYKPEIDLSQIKHISLDQIADIIEKDWVKVPYSARPYLDGLHNVTDMNDRYGADNAESIVAYFLSNASNWKGNVATKIKAELKRRLKST